jgi:hypothetical protein
MHDELEEFKEFLDGLQTTDEKGVRTQFDNLTDEMYGRGQTLPKGATREEVISMIRDLLREPSDYMDYMDDDDDQEEEDVVGRLPESVVRVIVAEGAALKLAGLLGSCELNYDAIQEAIHDDALRSMLAEADVYAPHSEVVAMISGLDPDEVSDSDYVADDSGEVLLAAGQKAGSSPYHPSYKNVRKPSWYMDDHDHDEDDVGSDYDAAVQDYVSGFEGESFEDPEGMAPDAAEGFFALNPQWKTWAASLKVSRSDIKNHVAELISAAIMGESLRLEAEYKGRKVSLGKPMKGDVAKFKVYVRDKKTGNVKKVNFGDKNAEIRRDNPKARKSFRARHGCGKKRSSDRTKAAYWSCRMWSSKPVSKIIKGK